MKYDFKHLHYLFSSICLYVLWWYKKYYQSYAWNTCVKINKYKCYIIDRLLMCLGCMYTCNNNSLSEVWRSSNILFRIFLVRSHMLFLFTGLFIHRLILCNFKPSSSCILFDAAVVVHLVVVLVIILEWCSVIE